MLIFLKALAERQKTIFTWYLKEHEDMKTINKREWLINNGWTADYERTAINI